MSLALPDPADPEISVVMVTYGAWELAERAVLDLIAHTRTPFELIAVDNRSPDQTRTSLAGLQGARVILNETNRGFGPATNQGAELARGRYLVLLNPDAYVRPGWDEQMLEALQRPRAGAVVPMYLNPDGSLQEAGSLLARDGTVWVYGDGANPDHPSYRFSRVVDYGAAACMLIRRETFRQLGGFDERYAPAYYEDSDLCLRLAERGLSVVYEPRARVTHARYGSGAAASAAALSERNRGRFVERWGSRLDGRPWTFKGVSEQAVIAARDAMARPRVLICASPDERAAEALARRFLTGWPAARVTWALAPDAVRFDPEPCLQVGIEIIDHDGSPWLEQRLFHYDLIVLGGALDDRTAARLDQTQPQAVSVPLRQLEDRAALLSPRPDAVLASAGIAPPRSSAAPRHGL